MADPPKCGGGDKDAVLEIFRKWDASGSGFITEDELRAVLVSLGVREANVRRVFAAADANCDGKIDYEEFIGWVQGSAPAAVRRAAGVGEQSLWARRPQAVTKASCSKFKEQAIAGRSKQYGAIGSMDYEVEAFLLDVGTGKQRRERVFGLSEMLAVLKETRTPAEFSALRFLDLGCANGQSLWTLRDTYGIPWSQIVGVTAEDMRGVEVLDGQVPFDLRAVAGPESDASYVVWNIDVLDQCPALRDRQFDVVISWVTWCWITDSMGDLEMVYDRFLSPGGVIFFGSVQLMTDSGDAEADVGLLQAISKFLSGEDGLQVLAINDAAISLYTWWMQRKKPSPSAPKLRLGRLLDYLAARPVDADCLKATYVATDVLTATLAAGKGTELPSLRLWDGSAEGAAESCDIDGYLPRAQLDLAGVLRAWEIAEPAEPAPTSRVSTAAAAKRGAGGERAGRRPRPTR